MKSTMKSLLVTCLAILSLLPATVASGQVTTSRTPIGLPTELTPTQTFGDDFALKNTHTINRQTHAGRRPPEATPTPLEQLQQAKNDEDKTAAKDLIRNELAQQYDQFIEVNQQQLAQMRERLEKLEQQLKRRREAKERLVNLKLQTVVSQAEGLGWPDAQSSSGVVGWPAENFTSYKYGNVIRDNRSSRPSQRILPPAGPPHSRYPVAPYANRNFSRSSSSPPTFDNSTQPAIGPPTNAPSTAPRPVTDSVPVPLENGSSD